MEDMYKSTLKARDLATNLWEEELNLYEHRIHYVKKALPAIQIYYVLIVICIHALIRYQANGFEYLFVIIFSNISVPFATGKIEKFKLKCTQKRLKDFWFYIKKSDVVIGKMEFYSKNVLDTIEKEIMSMYPERSILRTRKEKIFQFFVHIFFLCVIGMFFIKNRMSTNDQLILNVYMVQHLIYAGIFSSGFLTFRNFKRI